jgi:uncharacterized protein
MTTGEDEQPGALAVPETWQGPELQDEPASAAFLPLAPQHILVEKQVARISALVLSLLALVGLTLAWFVGDMARGWWITLAVCALAFVIGLWVLAAKWPPLEYRHAGYRVGAGSIDIKTGVIWRSIATVPRARIQHTDVAQGPLQRNHGLATLVIYTAGTSYSKLVLAGLHQADAQRIRDELLGPGGAHGA